MKFKNITVIAAFVVAIALSSVYPLINHYTDKTIPPLPAYHSYDNAIQALRDSVVTKATRNKCKRKFIFPVQKIQGTQTLIRNFPSILEDVNLALASYRKWKMAVTTHEKAAMRQRYEENVEKWKNLINFKDVKKSMNQQAQNDFNIQYSALVKLKTSPTSTNGDDLLLILTVNSNKTQSRVFTAEVPFVNPQTLIKWKKVRAAKKTRLDKLRKLADFSLKLMFLFTGLLLLWLLFLTGHYLYVKFILRKKKEYFLIEIQKRQELADNGDFVAAYDMVEKYLKLFPDDSEVQAFRERLLDFTNNDLKKAQVAFVEAKKLQLRLQLAKNDPRQTVLSPDEKQQIAPYLPYNPQLKQSYLAMEAGEEEIQKQKEFGSQLKTLKKILTTGKIYEAKRLFQEITDQYPDKKEEVTLQNLGEKIAQKMEDAEKKRELLLQNLSRGKITDTLRALKEILRQFPDIPEMAALQETINRSKGITHFSLVPRLPGKKIAVYCGNQWLLGRSDDLTSPDIDFNDKRVSRKHARIFAEEKEVMIEDLNSTGGTYINGGKITKQRLKNGDLLNLGKIIDMKTTLFLTEKEMLGGLILSGLETDYLLLFSHIPLDFKAEGLCIGSNGFSLYYQNNLVLFSLGRETVFPEQDKEIILNNNRYIVEVLK